MKIKKRDADVLLEFVNDKLSLREAQKKMKLKSMTMVYVRAFHLLKASLKNHDRLQDQA